MRSPLQRIVLRMTPTERLVTLVGVLIIVATLSATALTRLTAPQIVVAAPAEATVSVPANQVNR